ncbi:signal transducing adapter molecule 1 [Drosophila guanche]|uniref:Blast:Signal transducing adapter molecule 1 n=2 Tax=Drosophila guanche TaxID=7266 RepID=A0A3B0JN15_DROGU|nr:signal transducing adapter molecule 1 [Drosophila guanche]XP_034129031.1 signal transducing adapter molecule 1 [Drosophila guanche]SPP81732.1 blast:Signal transducing adapter molecule 1 [Drosophila guanche]
MGIFGQSSPFDADVEKATSETNTNDNWSLILDVCDKVSTTPRLAKDCLKAVMRRMGHNDPHVVMQAITLLDACSNNCGKPFHLEVASRDFETEFRRLLTRAEPKVSLKMRQVLKNWAENDYKNDRELDLIPALYTKLRLEGYDFKNLSEKSSKTAAEKAASLPKDPNVVSSQQEEDDIAKAIELSLKEGKSSPKAVSGSAPSAANTSAYPSLYPSFGGGGATSSSTTSNEANSTQNQAPAAEPRKVRALYDFEAAEENELTFFAGEIIHVMDDSDPNWWKGFNQRGEGLFPSNFVTADLSVDPERLDINQQHKTGAAPKDVNSATTSQQKTDPAAAAAAAAASAQPVEIDEAKIDRLLHLLHEANPEDPSQDSDEMLRLEQEVHQMGPLIDAELERVDRKHAQLTQLSSDLVDAINLYHGLMRDDRAVAGQFAAAAAGFMPGLAGFPGAALYGAPGYPSAGGFPPHQNYPGMHSLPYAPGPNIPTNAPPPTTAPAGYLEQGQVPLTYQNGHAPQMNSLPPHLPHLNPAVSVPQPLYNAHAPPVSAQQQQQQAPPPQQQQQPSYQQQQPPFAQVPPANTQMQQQQSQPPPQAYMQAGPPQGYQPGPTPQQPPSHLYAPNGSPAVNQQSYVPQQQQQHQLTPQEQYSQMHQQMASQPAAAPGYHMQNDAVKNNIPIYQQQW